MSGHRLLVLGGGDGWHADQLRRAADRRGCQLHFATYESLRARVSTTDGCQLRCEAGDVTSFDAILTRTMPAGSLEQISFRLAMLHNLSDSHPRSHSPALVNPARALEIAIDKFTTLARVAELGYRVPETIIVQSRREAIDAFRALGGDCVVKPIFGGEGRGVMRIRDVELAWYSFGALEQVAAMLYVQKFVSPGGLDTRLLVIGETVIGLRRENAADFRTNVAGGASCAVIEPSDSQVTMARRICAAIGLKFASVDLLDSDDGPPCVVEVNGIPGWRGAQRVAELDIADRIVQLLCQPTLSPQPVRSDQVGV